ncbi:FAD-binding protein [Frankia sp. QA3]|uniref:FAD-binding protein n=1 Tax=Frankia sp. QA3 TaxID=710111 RepID=UPI000686233A|nr:FAD-binding protein [Frankia sp. QA3]
MNLPASTTADAVDETFDVIVVGFGGAGACAAIAAAEAGTRVLVLDRFYGGGSTIHSGGVVYAGGGTAQQEQAGIADTVEGMYEYLRLEVGDAVGEKTLRRFVEGSREMVEWLGRQGLEFEGSLCPYKTSYPTNRHYLYYSGNELASGYADVAPPAPRGHRTHARNFSGATFYGRLRESALRLGVTFRPLAEVQSLVVDDGRVVGVEYDAPLPGREPGGWHRKFTELAAKAHVWNPAFGARLSAVAVAAARRRSTRRRVRATGGVVLTTGGHGFNRELVARHAPAWAGLTALGTAGDTGAALRLAADVDAATSHLEKMSGWRFLSPPSAFMRGIVVSAEGARIANEQLYGATLSTPLVEDHHAHGYLVVDAQTWRSARGQIREQSAFFHLPQLAYLFGPAGHRRAATLAELARGQGIDPAGLEKTVREYNETAAAGLPDPFGKNGEFHRAIGDGPYYSVDVSARASSLYPFPFITLGGLVVDEDSGAVLRRDGSIVPGLYAGGRSAVGLCSNSYVSGLSLADAVFSGRRAGAHAAGGSVPSTQREFA